MLRTTLKRIFISLYTTCGQGADTFITLVELRSVFRDVFVSSPLALALDNSNIALHEMWSGASFAPVPGRAVYTSA